MSKGFLTIKARLFKTRAVADQKAISLQGQQVKINILLILTLAAISILYLVQVNTLATKGYTIKDIEKQISAAKKDNARLQMKSIEQGSLSTLTQKIGSLKLVRSERVDYVLPKSVAALR